MTDRLAHLYDLQLGLERRAIGAAVEMLAPRAGDRLLDVGTGTGAVMRAVAAGPERPAEVVGIDSSRRMLARAARHSPRQDLVVGDATRLPFEDARFSAVAAVYLLHLLPGPDADRAASELRRVTHRGGRVLVVAPAVPTGVLAGPYRGLVRMLAGVSAASLGLRPLDPAPLLERHGLHVRRARYVTGGYPSLCVLAQA